MFERVLVWIATSVMAVTFALSWLPAVFDGTHYVPLGPDSFYHARRMLDVAADPHAFYQFDSMIHAPDGSLLTWPWAYDFAAGYAARLLMPLLGITDPMRVLVYIPVVFVLVNSAVLLALGVHFRLPRFAFYLLAGCYALSPLTRELHAVGQLDHHFLEQLCFFAALLSGSQWLRRSTPLSALTAGAVLGAAPALHNGLFVLQIFLLGGLLLLWLRRLFEPGVSVYYFGVALVGMTILILLPSEPFYRGEWSYYYLGWFHLAAACATAMAALVLCWFKPNSRSVLVGMLVLIALGLVAADQIVQGGRFVFAAMPALRDVSEARSVFQLLLRGEYSYLTRRYSGLLWLLPVIWAGLGMVALRTRDAGIVYTCVALGAGSVLLMQQLRLHYFGSLTLYLPLLLAASHFIRCLRPSHRIGAIALLYWLVGAALWPGVRTFGSYPPFAGDINYSVNRRLFTLLGDHCRTDPGVVLALFGDGHYVRYHTRCRSIADNFIMTPQHLERIAYTEARFASSAEDLRRNHPWIRYVYVQRQDNPLVEKSRGAARAANPRLIQELLLAPTLPAGFETLGESVLTHRDGEREPIARVLRVD